MNESCLHIHEVSTQIDYKKAFLLFNTVSDEKSSSLVTHFHQLSKKNLILIAKKQ